MIDNFLLITIAVINCFTFAIYGIDKIKAVNNEWRVSEKRLLSLSMLGPFGSLLGMKLFRHKVKKPRFYVGIPFFAIVQLILISLYMAFIH